jgi:hypothetical protein
VSMVDAREVHVDDGSHANTCLNPVLPPALAFAGGMDYGPDLVEGPNFEEVEPEEPEDSEDSEDSKDEGDSEEEGNDDDDDEYTPIDPIHYTPSA